MCLKHSLLIILALFSGINCNRELHNEKFNLESFLPHESRFMSDRNLTRGDYCVQDCLKEKMIPRKVREFFDDVARDVFRRQNSTNIRQIFNATMLDWYCGTHHKNTAEMQPLLNHRESQFLVNPLFRYANGRQKCILKCNNDSFLKTEILKLLRPTSYICNETDFIAQSKCYRQVYEDDVDKCESGDKCLPYKTNMISFIHEKMRRADNISLEDGIEYVTSNLCQYIICGNQCRLNDLTKRCGDESSQLLLEFYRRLVSTMKTIIVEMYRSYTNGKELILTDTCDQI